MIEGNFTPQDKCEYIFNTAHYRPSSGIRHVRRRLGKLKVYIVLVIISIGGGAGAVYLPKFLTPAEDQDSLGSLKDPADLMEKVKNNPALFKQLKEQYGR
ncbi:MAG: hypothetical protein A2268_16985 [Candidatus Raymondbacteria bacterium RifOxyA12_full_50_37]|uniref:Uncharacterized protein n=1 Tax=Candidatus Raymondbacteria bacterium RIFOXYD12_FULL_49_13 TaxID=1817890 RepID=A0A1F7FD61_UNCRA|nr:MAG: hypothetical protein A2268_16985 [Candidatus Raymondbacteria bacterium RifOxyA12_full_50_37]OGJ86304.1 MAG: hypothetical protein A2248_16585 [Candidatus Raymondbacteria bacterium RIFOXYA2_FULL_49_16]OGJ89987.1 MAG: hypothetical protein A2350_08040 [Candidatus Raymondbacteria bacterium RifOxyB12_full_50_8]OGJ95842.1 MAG: hypothetical protein A2453_11895 [Candidatus Raymondbacteria bacterium RIFOXYC2_FULL_50_21]OGJ96518.1 MAG: hypothetical protein A2487_19920 [Candidatus Raymondbacteria b